MSQEWKLVPVVPTEEMRDAGNVEVKSRTTLFAAWRAMLAAAPVPPAGGEVEVCGTCQGHGEIPAGGMQHFGYNQPPEPWMMTCPECAGDPLVISDEYEIQRYSLCGFEGGLIEKYDGHLVGYDDHLAIVKRLQLVAETCKANCDEMLQRAQQAEKKRDALKAEVESLHQVLEATRTARDAEKYANDELRTELTKARELLASTSARLHSAHRNIDRLFELEPKHKVKLLTDALHTIVYAYKCIDNPAHQSAPAAKGEGV